MASGDFENIPHLVWDRVYFGYWIESLEERWEERKKRWERFVEEDSEEELEGHSDEDRKGFAEEAYLYSEEIKPPELTVIRHSKPIYDTVREYCGEIAQGKPFDLEGRQRKDFAGGLLPIIINALAKGTLDIGQVNESDVARPAPILQVFPSSSLEDSQPPSPCKEKNTYFDKRDGPPRSPLSGEDWGRLDYEGKYPRKKRNPLLQDQYVEGNGQTTHQTPTKRDGPGEDLLVISGSATTHQGPCSLAISSNPSIPSEDQTNISLDGPVRCPDCHPNGPHFSPSAIRGRDISLADHTESVKVGLETCLRDDQGDFRPNASYEGNSNEDRPELITPDDPWFEAAKSSTIGKGPFRHRDSATSTPPNSHYDLKFIKPRANIAFAAASLALTFIPLAAAQQAQSSPLQLQSVITHISAGISIASSLYIIPLRNNGEPTQQSQTFWIPFVYVAWSVSFVVLLTCTLLGRPPAQKKLLIGTVLFTSLNLLGTLIQSAPSTLEGVLCWGAVALTASLFAVPVIMDSVSSGSSDVPQEQRKAAAALTGIVVDKVKESELERPGVAKPARVRFSRT